MGACTSAPPLHYLCVCVCWTFSHENMSILASLHLTYIPYLIPLRRMHYWHAFFFLFFCSSSLCRGAASVYSWCTRHAMCTMPFELDIVSLLFFFFIIIFHLNLFTTYRYRFTREKKNSYHYSIWLLVLLWCKTEFTRMQCECSSSRHQPTEPCPCVRVKPTTHSCIAGLYICVCVWVSLCEWRHRSAHVTWARASYRPIARARTEHRIPTLTSEGKKTTRFSYGKKE